MARGSGTLPRPQRAKIFRAAAAGFPAAACQVEIIGAGRHDEKRGKGNAMADRRDDIAAELERGLAETVLFFRSLSPEQLRTRLYQDGAQWTVQQVPAHFAVIERSMHRLFADILAGGPGAPPEFDVDRYNLTQTRKLDGLSLEELIVRFTAVRRETIRIVREMQEEDLDREGMHAFHGKGKLERFIRWAYEHARIHEEDIRKELLKPAR
jgi:hypothetical protein